MDQLKLLNFHKMIANFANNLVGAFVPLIIYQATNSLTYAITYLVCYQLLRLLLTLSFKKLYFKYAQLLLLLRIIPIALYNIFIFVLDVNLIIGIIGVCLFLAIDYSLNNLSKEAIFNYSSLSKNDTGKSSIGVTRLFEQAGVIIALIAGGFLLDFNKTFVVILSLAIYGISVIPLAIYYVKSKNSKTFNKDATSNAVNTLSKNKNYERFSKKITTKMLLTYGIVYFSFAFIDLLQTTFSLYVFIQKGDFATSGILNAIYHCFYAAGCYVAGILNEKKDITKLVSFANIIVALCAITLPFIDVNNLFILVCLIYGTIGFSCPFISLFVLERMLLKSRIMGISNDALFTRETSCLIAYVVGYSFGFIGLIAIFIVMTITMASAGVIIPAAEEKTRQHLVNFLQNNENSKQPQKQKHKYVE